jgi:hypothetical protein
MFGMRDVRSADPSKSNRTSVVIAISPTAPAHKAISSA